MTSIKKNVNGFSLVEALIGLALVSILGLVSAQLVTYMQTSLRTAEVSAEVVEFYNSVGLVVTNPQLCVAAFSGAVINPAVGAKTLIPKLVGPSGAAIAVASPAANLTKLVNGTQQLASIALTITSSSAGQLTGSLVLNFQKVPSQTSFPGLGSYSNTNSRPINISLTLNPDNTVASCSLANSGLTCPAGQFVTSVDVNGSASCSTNVLNPVNPANTCPGGTFVTSVSPSDGSVGCSAPPPPPPPADGGAGAGGGGGDDGGGS